MYRAAQVLTRMGKQYVKQVTVPVKSDQITVGNTTIKLYQGDILNLPFAVDAIVNPANSRLAPLGGLSKKIFNVAGTKELQDEIKQKFSYKKSGEPIVPPGAATVTSSYSLKQTKGIRFILHAVGPDCKIPDQKKTFVQLLSNAYWSALQIHGPLKIKSIAFPFISSELFECPKEESAKIALNTVINYVQEHESTKKLLYSLDTIYFILFTPEDYEIFRKALAIIKGEEIKPAPETESNFEKLLKQLKNKLQELLAVF